MDGKNERVVSCTRNGKWITSFAAIVAPPCDVGQGRVRVRSTGASRFTTA